MKCAVLWSCILFPMTVQGCLAAICAVSLMAQTTTGNQYYADTKHPLVRLGAQRVFKTISYPDWFLWPVMSKDVRQQLVDSYTTREFLVSFDRSTGATTSERSTNLIGAIFDFTTSLLGASQKDSSQVARYTRAEA